MDRWIGRKMTLKLCFTKRKVESAASHRGGMIAQLYSCTRASQRYLPTYLCRNRWDTIFSLPPLYHIILQHLLAILKRCQIPTKIISSKVFLATSGYLPKFPNSELTTLIVVKSRISVSIYLSRLWLTRHVRSCALSHFFKLFTNNCSNLLGRFPLWDFAIWAWHFVLSSNCTE